MPLESLKDVRERLCKRVKKCNRTDATILDKVLRTLEDGHKRCDDPSLTAEHWNMWSLLYSLATSATDVDIRQMAEYMQVVTRDRLKKEKGKLVPE